MRMIDSRHFFSAAAIAALLLTGFGYPAFAAEQTDGAALYQKHCAACHPDGAKLKPINSLINALRTPPIGMPTFGEDRLDHQAVEMIGAYLQVPVAEEPRAAQKPDVQQDPEPATKPAQDAPAKPRKSLEQRKSWLKGFGTSGL